MGPLRFGIGIRRHRGVWYVAPDPLHPDILYGGKFTKFDRRTGQIQDVSPWVIRTGKYRLNRSQP